MSFSTEASLRSWERKVSWRRNRLLAAKRAHNTARVKKWRASLKHAVWMVSVRKKQLDAGATVDVAQVESHSQGLTEEAAGRKLFELIAACRDAGIDPDSALRRQTTKVVAEAELRAPKG